MLPTIWASLFRLSAFADSANQHELGTNVGRLLGQHPEQVFTPLAFLTEGTSAQRKPSLDRNVGGSTSRLRLSKWASAPITAIPFRNLALCPELCSMTAFQLEYNLNVRPP
jgi:hypothetical protein